MSDVKTSRKARVSRWWWFGVVAGAMPIGFDYVVLCIGHFSDPIANPKTEWLEPIVRGQVLLVAIGLLAATVAEVSASSEADEHQRAWLAGTAWAFSGFASVCYAGISSLATRHNASWDVKNGIFISLLFLVIAGWVTLSWARRKE